MADFSNPRNSVRRKLLEACKTDDVSAAREALAESPAFDETPLKSDVLDFLNFALHRAVLSNSIGIMTYLFQQGANVSKVTVSDVSRWGWSTPVVEALIQQGWDINTRGKRGLPLLHFALCDDNLVRWCLDHGASVYAKDQDVPNWNDGALQDTWDDYYLRCPPVLQCAAGSATVETFELLRSNGAPAGWRMLHEAVRRTVKTQPIDELEAENAGEEDPEFRDYEQRSKHARSWDERMRMVRHLVDTLGYDVSASDQPSPYHKLPNHYGTPLCYIQPYGDCKELTWFLLDRGADPLKKDAYGRSAIDYLEQYSPAVFQAIEEWKARQSSNSQK